MTARDYTTDESTFFSDFQDILNRVPRLADRVGLMATVDIYLSDYLAAHPEILNA